MHTTPTPRRAGAVLLTACLIVLFTLVPALAIAATTPSAWDTPGMQVGTQESSDAAPSLVLLMDSSGSMRDPDSVGQPKIGAARTALDSMITGLDPAEQVGFRVFGATVQGGEKNPKACTDSQLVVPIGTDNRPQLSAAVKDYQPKGDTPIGYALQEAAKDLGDEGNRTITLVSDGLATCDEDPCEIAADIAEQGIDLTIHVVGFDVDAKAREQMQCIASAGRGTYYDADDTQSLTAALDRLATRAFKPFTIQGTPVVGTETDNGAPELEPGGQYTDTLGAEEIPKHYLIKRTMPGSSIHVGVSALPLAGTSGQMHIQLQTPDGEDCNWEYAEGGAGGGSDVWQLLSGQVSAHADAEYGHDSCGDVSDLVLTVEQTKWQDEIAGMPYEILVSEEPPVSPDTQLPGEAEDPVWQEMATSDPQPVTPGASFNDAQALEPGKTYAGQILTGETAFFAVPVEFGEALQAQVTYPDPSPALRQQMEFGVLPSKLGLYSPHRGEVLEPSPDNTELDYFELLNDDSQTRLGATTAAARWRNRDINSAPTQRTSVDGQYVVTLSLDRDDDGSSYLVPFELTVDTFSDGTGAPTYATSPEGDVSDMSEPTTAEDDTAAPETRQDAQADSAGDPGTDDAAAEGDAAPSDADQVVPGAASAAGGDGVPTAVWVAVAVLGLGALGAGVTGIVRVLGG